MSARYLLRLDDACATMARGRWQAFEDFFDRRGIRPLVAVVPDNRDDDLRFEPADADFWTTVRRWQHKGWTIAMHGYQHRLRETDATMLLPFYTRSEFAGLDLQVQVDMLRKSLALFRQHGVQPTVWIAPAHCFDHTTLLALARATEIDLISDGLALAPYRAHGFRWLPQQLWTLRRKSRGLWTVCLHPNTMPDAQREALFAQIDQQYLGAITAVDALSLDALGGKTLADRLYSFWFWQRHRLLPRLLAWKRRLAGRAA